MPRNLPGDRLHTQGIRGVQHGFDHATITTIALIYNAGAVVGGIRFRGTFRAHRPARYQRHGSAAVTASSAVLAFGSTALTLGIASFLMQICVQGAWGVIPAHLNELSPPSIRATFPGVAHQLGNLLASYNATLQAAIGE